MMWWSQWLTCLSLDSHVLSKQASPTSSCQWPTTSKFGAHTWRLKSGRKFSSSTAESICIRHMFKRTSRMTSNIKEPSSKRFTCLFETSLCTSRRQITLMIKSIQNSIKSGEMTSLFFLKLPSLGRILRDANSEHSSKKLGMKERYLPTTSR